jgi:membrane protein implicated in regulation of membrane protease activity
MNWEVWLILCAILIVGEIFTASFFAGPLGAGCLVAALIANAEGGTAMQFFGFSVTSVVLLLALRPLLMRLRENKTNDESITGIKIYIGKQGRITEKVDAATGTGRIQIGGENWIAVSDVDIVIEEDSQATVIRIEGTKAIVSVSENP